MVNIVWTRKEENYIRKHLHLPDEEAAKKLSKLSKRNITKDAYRSKRKRMNIKKKSGRGVSEPINE